MKKIYLLSCYLVILLPAITCHATCTIKGITYGGAKVYYLPSHPQYDKIVVNEKQGDWWLCSEDEALEMGFRKATERSILDTDGVITDGDLADRRPLSLERVFKGVFVYAYPWALTSRNIFDQVSSNYYYIGNYLWVDVWGTKDNVEKVFLLTRFPPNMPGNSSNQTQITTLLKNVFPELPDIVDWVFQATQQDISITRESNKKMIKVESIVMVHQLTIWIQFQR
jgi:hypothetical protein